MNIRTKLTLGFLAVALLFGATSLLLSINNFELQGKTDELIHINIDETAYSSEAGFLIQRIKSNLREFMLLLLYRCNEP